MPITINLDPTPLRAIAIGILMFLLAVFTPTLASMQETGEFPTMIQFATYLITGLLVIVAYLLAFLKTGE